MTKRFYLTFFLKCDIMKVSGQALARGPAIYAPYYGSCPGFYVLERTRKKISKTYTRHNTARLGSWRAAKK